MIKKNDLPINIDDLVKKIEKRINELNKEEEKKKAKLDNTISNLDEIIKEIDRRIQELEKKETKQVEINLDKINERVNSKIAKLNEAQEEAIEKTIYDLNEITKKIDETIKLLEKKKKEKKRKKAMYCDMARRNQRKMKKGK